MGGEVGVHSRVGAGAAFWLTLPLRLGRGNEASPPSAAFAESGTWRC